jgi:hypothetical protein
MPQIGFLWAAGLATGLAMGSPLPGQGQDGPEPLSVEVAGDPQSEGPPHELRELAGYWDYNADDSINIQTGRQEQSPRSATAHASRRSAAVR